MISIVLSLYFSSLNRIGIGATVGLEEHGDWREGTRGLSSFKLSNSYTKISIVYWTAAAVSVLASSVLRRKSLLSRLLLERCEVLSSQSISQSGKI